MTCGIDDFEMQPRNETFDEKIKKWFGINEFEFDVNRALWTLGRLYMQCFEHSHILACWQSFLTRRNKIKYYSEWNSKSTIMLPIVKYCYWRKLCTIVHTQQTLCNWRVNIPLRTITTVTVLCYENYFRYKTDFQIPIGQQLVILRFIYTYSSLYICTQREHYCYR